MVAIAIVAAEELDWFTQVDGLDDEISISLTFGTDRSNGISYKSLEGTAKSHNAVKTASAPILIVRNPLYNVLVFCGDVSRNVLALRRRSNFVQDGGAGDRNTDGVLSVVFFIELLVASSDGDDAENFVDNGGFFDKTCPVVGCHVVRSIGPALTTSVQSCSSASMNRSNF